MSTDSFPDSWKTEKFRKSVEYKLINELKCFKLTWKDAGKDIEQAIFEHSTNKLQYLGYVGKIIILLKNRVVVKDEWLENRVMEILKKPPPRLRKVLSPNEMAKYNIEMMKIRSKIQQESILKIKPSTSTSNISK